MHRVTIGYDSDPCLLDVRPVLEDLSDASLVLDADILTKKVSLESHASNRCVSHQTLWAPVDMRVVKTRIAHGWCIDQGCDFREVLSTEPVKSVEVCIPELREVLCGIT